MVGLVRGIRNWLCGEVCLCLLPNGYWMEYGFMSASHLQHGSCFCVTKPTDEDCEKLVDIIIINKQMLFEIEIAEAFSGVSRITPSRVH